MHKYLFFLLLAYLPFSSSAQQGTKIVLEKADHSRTEVKGEETVVYARNPRFRQDNVVLTCDSAVFYNSQNYFEAFKNVHINQADTLNIYAQRLTYNGNTKLAHLSDKVRLVDKDNVLTTNILDYDVAARIGTYVNGGRIVNKDVKIDSRNGYYFANSRDAYFRYNVVAVTEQSTIKSDTLRYNTLTSNTYFYGPTNIKGKDDNLYTENGVYNTKTEDAYFGKNNKYTQGSKTLWGDSLYYYGKRGYGRAVKNIVFIDTAEHAELRGQLGEYYKDGERAVITRNAFFGIATSDTITVDDIKKLDTLWVTGDTLETQMVLQKTLVLIPKPVVRTLDELAKSASAAKPAVLPVNAGTDSTQVSTKLVKKPDSLVRNDSNVVKPPPAVKAGQKNNKDTLAVVKQEGKAPPVAKDTVINVMDTLRTRVIKAYHNVKVFKSDLQAKADSLFYTNADSTLRWYRNPILWAEGSQQTGDTIYAQFKNKKVNTVEVLENGFVVNVEDDSTHFNQIKGKYLLGLFKDGQLNRMIVDGNAESIYYERDAKTKEYLRMNQGFSARINALFEDKQLAQIENQLGHQGVLTPTEELTGEHKLTGFTWKPEERPKSKEDIIGPPYQPPAKPKPVKTKAVTPKPSPAKPVKGKTGKSTTTKTTKKPVEK